ncbi:MAG: fibronectin type III domain-containing protein [Gammaproteobacteria bacterium]|nr:fibronectin type III domain-containing protein [Gammaproteobacteria bacterium]
MITLLMLPLAACGGGGGGGSPPPTPPAPPQIGQVTPADRALAVAFTPPSVTGGAPITQFTASCRTGTQEPVTSSGAGSPITVGGLVNGREYSCSVTARNSAGESPPSTTATAIPYTTPAAPSLASLAPADGALEAVFSAPADTGGNAIIDYRLSCTAAGSTRSIVGASSPLRLSGLANGTAFSCSVAARNAAGEGAVSIALVATPRTLPGAPAITTIGAEISGLVVAFSPPTADGGAAISRYTVQCTGGGFTRSVTRSTSPVFVDLLANFVTYSCSVRAGNAAGDGPESTSASGTPRDLALDAQLSTVIDQTARRATLSWRDTFPSGTVYRIETQSGNGSFVERATVGGRGGTGATLTWTTEVNEPLTLRIVAVREGRSDLLKTAQSATTVIAAIVSTTSPPSIVASSAEPLSGTVTLSLSGGVAYPLVEWFINVNLIGVTTQSGGQGNPVSWTTTGLLNGEYLVVARIQTASGTFVEVRRIVRVANISITVSTQTFGGTGSAGPGLFLIAQVASSAGISSVEARIEGASLGVLTAPNCSDCSSASNSYRWRIDTVRYPSGSYAVVVAAADRDGVRRVVDYTLQVRNPPVVRLDTPSDFDIVFGKLVVRGTVSSDRAGAVRTTATLGSLPILESTAASFEGTLDVSGLTGGQYTLTVRSVDSAGVSTNLTRSIIVTTSEERKYLSVLTLGDDVTLVESDGQHLLLVGPDRLYRLQSLMGGASIILAGSDRLEGLTGWKLDAGRVVAQGRGGDCSTVCIFEWDLTGARRNLSAANPFSSVGSTRCSDQDPISRGNFVMWANWLCGKGTYTIFNRGSGNYQKIDPPPGANYIGNIQFDLLADGSVALIWAQMGGSGMSSTFDVFRVSGGTSTRLSVPGSRNVYPRASGSRVVWEQSPIGGNADNTVELVSSSLSGGGLRSIGSRVNEWLLTEQMLVWAEVTTSAGAPISRAVKVETGGNVSTIASQPGLLLFGASGTQVIYADNSRFYRWDASQGTRTLLLEMVPMQVWVARGVLVFTPGGGRVYRVPIQ